MFRPSGAFSPSGRQASRGRHQFSLGVPITTAPEHASGIGPICFSPVLLRPGNLERRPLMKRLILGSVLILTAGLSALSHRIRWKPKTSYKPVPLNQPWRGSTYSGSNIGQYYPRLYYEMPPAQKAPPLETYPAHAQVFSPKFARRKAL